MDVSNRTQSSSYRPESSPSEFSPGNEAHVAQAASALLKEGKKMANGLYHDGIHKVSDMQESIKGYSDEVAHKVHAKPLMSLLIAGGIGFILSAIFHR